MFKRLFNPDSGLMLTMAQVTDCIFLSLFWALGCFPLITVGASSAALYDAVYHGFRKGDKHAWSRFLRTYKNNFRVSLVPSLVYLAGFFALVWVLIQLWNAAALGKISMALFSAGAFLGMIVLGILSVMFPMLSRFENSVSSLLRNTLLLSMANLPRTLALGVLNGISIFLTVRYIYPLFFLPALANLLGTLFLEPMFRPYMPKEIPEDAA